MAVGIIAWVVIRRQGCVFKKCFHEKRTIFAQLKNKGHAV